MAKLVDYVPASKKAAIGEKKSRLVALGKYKIVFETRKRSQKSCFGHKLGLGGSVRADIC